MLNYKIPYIFPVHSSLVFLSFSAVLYLTSCGDVKLGPVPAPNDPPPSGTKLSSGTFVSQNGKIVNGIASVYQRSSNGLIVIRLEGISTPEESGLNIQAMRGSEIGIRSNLRSFTGTQNYSTQKTETTGWTSIQILSSNTQTLYGTANLEAVKTDFYPGKKNAGGTPDVESSPNPSASPTINTNDTFFNELSSESL